MNSTKVLDIFKEITLIPRESGHEGPMTAYLQKFAADRSLDCKTDATGNVLITRQASPGKENIPTLVLQSHQDMVCEKNAGIEHDFRRDPVRYIIRDGWMIAPDTTLGADDGIGIAASLALLDNDLPCGTLECLFTISEETGMDGAENLQSGFFTGKTLINLDSEDEGQMFIGCAGGLNTKVTLKYGSEPLKDGFSAVRLFITGAIGGHSGDDINKERMNTVQQMARFLYGEMKEGMQLVSICGGGKPNAIARECEAIIAVPDPETTCRRFLDFGASVKNNEFSRTEPSVSFIADKTSSCPQSVDSKTASDLIAALFSMPHGVQAMSQTVPGLVETSSNLASVRMEDGCFVVVTSQRSAIKSARRMMADRIEAAFAHTGAKVEKQYEYPGWVPDPDSPILKQCVESYRRLFGEEPMVLAIHAGLECGLFLEKFPGLDMISFGPTLRGVHAPGERLDLNSMDKFVKHLTDVVCNFK